MKELFGHTLSQIGMYLYRPKAVVTNQVFQQGLLTNQGLLKENEGRIDTLMPSKRPPKSVLGYF